MMFTCQPPSFLEPYREATDLRFKFHVLVAWNQVRKHGKSDAMLVLVSVFCMTLLPEPTTNPAIDPLEFVMDDATVPELPKGFLQLPVSVNFLLVEPRAGFL